jgi:RimJ/RimL family protein N-acetyltransferase
MDTLFRCGEYLCVELGRSDIAHLQRFFDENPEYFYAVNGSPPGPAEAEKEYNFQLPKDWPFEKKWLLGVVSREGQLLAMADFVSNLFAERVWHIGLFVVQTSLHGTGAAGSIYRQLEAWIKSSGGQWIRLGVVAGNVRAERFWERAGYVEVRRRPGVEMGNKINTLRVMVKPLSAAPLREYLELVARDRPDDVEA